jgi:hypothetical protein
MSAKRGSSAGHGSRNPIPMKISISATINSDLKEEINCSMHLIATGLNSIFEVFI